MSFDRRGYTRDIAQKWYTERLFDVSGGPDAVVEIFEQERHDHSGYEGQDKNNAGKEAYPGKGRLDGYRSAGNQPCIGLLNVRLRRRLLEAIEKILVKRAVCVGFAFEVPKPNACVIPSICFFL